MKNKKIEIETSGKKLKLDKVVVSNLDLTKVKGGITGTLYYCSRVISC